MRDFHMDERLKMQFRVEAYSAMNHPQWGNPGNSLNNRNTFRRGYERRRGTVD